jgi:hypothetical protein
MDMSNKRDIYQLSRLHPDTIQRLNNVASKEVTGIGWPVVHTNFEIRTLKKPTKLIVCMETLAVRALRDTTMKGLFLKATATTM